MYGTAARGISAYKKTDLEIGVMAANPHKLVVMLFEGAKVAIASASRHMRHGETAAKGICISKAISIVDEGLKASLDMTAGGDLAQKLAALYEYMSGRLLQANLANEIALLSEVYGLLGDLQHAWESIGGMASVAPPAAAPPSVPARSQARALKA
jgi:flagellar protein FliS